MDCGLGGVCGGCAWRGRPWAEQVAGWRDGLAVAGRGGWSIDEVGEDGLRDRADAFQWRDGEVIRLGLGRLDGDGVVEIGLCTALSPALAAWRADLAADPPPLPGKAALRLRVSPDGLRGVWVDAANIDLKGLLDEGAWLARQVDAGVVVELGQRRKEAVRLEGQWKLREGAPRPWFRTWLDEDRPAAVFGQVGGFSQPSLVANQALVRRVREAIDAVGAAAWVEVGCGAGNLTLPLAARTERVLAVDADPSALDALTAGLAAAGLVGRVETLRAGLDGGRLAARLAGFEAALVDPPRSGLGVLVDHLDGLRGLVYVSCSSESLARDLDRLVARGWRVEGGVGVAQFPQTPHVEWVVRLAR